MKYDKLKKLALAAAVTVSFSSYGQQATLFDQQLHFDHETADESELGKTGSFPRGRTSRVLRSLQLSSDFDAQLQLGNVLSVEIDHQLIQIKLTDIQAKNSSTTYINGAVIGGNGSFSMVRKNGRYSATIRVGNRGYLLTPAENGTYNLSSFIDDAQPVDAHPVEQKQEHDNHHNHLNSHLQKTDSLKTDSLNKVMQKPLQADNVAPSMTIPEVTVVVAYTAKLAAEVGDVDAYLALMEKDTNDSYIASGINARVNITHSYQTDYVSTGDMAEDNSLLLNENTSDWLPNPNPLAPNGFGVELKSFRDGHQADVMVFLADRNASSPWAGWAGQIGTDDASALFTLSSWGTFKNTFAHELGHLYGARHDNDPGTTPFAYGHGYCNDAKTWHTMMAITDCGNRLNVWSNPNETYEGEAGGTADTHDNARVHNERVATMAAFRTSAHNAPVATITQANVISGDLSVSFVGEATDNDGNVVSALWDFGDGVYHNTPYAQGNSVTHTYPFPGTYTARYTATDNDGLIHSVTQQVNVTASPGNSYCAAKGNNAVFQYIQNVAVNGLAHDSGRRQYTDHTGLTPFTLHAATDTGIALQQGTRGSTFGPYSAYWAVYVDLNQNNSFDDPGELLHFSTPRNDASREPVLASIRVPQSALAGTTRMRVIQSNTLRAGESQLAACGDFAFGEAEDFTVNIVKTPSPADFNVELNANMSVGFSTTASNIASVEWDFGDALFSQDNGSISLSPNHTYAFGGSYTVTLTVTLTTGETFTQTKVIEITPPAGENYCRAYGNQPAFQFTENVSLNGASLDSGSAHYSDHTSTVFGAVVGDNRISVRQGATGTDPSYTANWRVYIDMNQNGEFETSESVWYWVGANTSNDVVRTFTIPATAQTGQTRMRVIQSFEEFSSPCGAVRWGEVEDFTVNIVSSNPAAFNANVSANNLTVQFSDNLASNSSISSVEYDFGDSVVNPDHTSNQGNPSHTYLYTGTYTVTLTATMNNGVKYQQQRDVTVSGDAYCMAYGKSNTQWTSNVRVGSLNNASDKSQFARYDNTGFAFTKGTATDIGLTHNSNGPYLANWVVYIDLNQNNRFDDAGERLLQTSATTFNEVVNAITVPASAASGQTTMRVMQSFELTDGTIPACGTFEWGEVEDYLVSVNGDDQPSSDLLNGVTKTGIAVTAGEVKTFSFYVPAGATDVSVQMGAGTGDPDLYVKFGDQNTTSNWACRPYIGGNRDESCGSDTLTQSGGIYYVSVRGWTASNNVTLTGSYTDGDVIVPPPPPANACETEAPQTRGNLSNDQAICLGSQTVYVAISVPAGQAQLTISTQGGDGDASVYQHTAGWPASTFFEHSATTANNSNETIVIQNPRSGWHYILVTGQGTGAELVAKFQ